MQKLLLHLRAMLSCARRYLLLVRIRRGVPLLLKRPESGLERLGCEERSAPADATATKCIHPSTASLWLPRTGKHHDAFLGLLGLDWGLLQTIAHQWLRQYQRLLEATKNAHSILAFAKPRLAHCTFNVSPGPSILSTVLFIVFSSALRTHLLIPSTDLVCRVPKNAAANFIHVQFLKP